MFLRVDEIGRAEALDYEALTWQNDPLHPSTKYFLRQFVTDHYSRRFATVGERWPHSLAFLERSLAAAPAEAHQQEITGILGRSDPRGPRHGESRAAHPGAPGGAPRGDRRLRHRAPAERGEVARERWTTNIQFVFRDVDPYELTTNPIGLIITYYAEDRAVSSGG